MAVLRSLHSFQGPENQMLLCPFLGPTASSKSPLFEFLLQISFSLVILSRGSDGGGGWGAHRGACGMLVPQLGIEPGPSAAKAWSPNHVTTGEFFLGDSLPAYLLFAISSSIKKGRKNNRKI